MKKKNTSKTQKYPFYPKVNKKKWESELVTKKDNKEYKDYYGHDAPKTTKNNGG